MDHDFIQTISKVRDDINIDINIDSDCNIVSIDSKSDKILETLKELGIEKSDTQYKDLEELLIEYNLFDIYKNILEYTLKSFFPKKNCILYIIQTIDESNIDQSKIIVRMDDLVYTTTNDVILYNMEYYYKNPVKNWLTLDIIILKYIIRIEELVLEAGYDFITMDEELFDSSNIYYIDQPDFIRSGIKDNKKYIAFNKTLFYHYMESYKADNDIDPSLFGWMLLNYIMDFIY